MTTPSDEVGPNEKRNPPLVLVDVLAWVLLFSLPTTALLLDHVSSHALSADLSKTTVFMISSYAALAGGVWLAHSGINQYSSEKKRLQLQSQPGPSEDRYLRYLVPFGAFLLYSLTLAFLDVILKHASKG